MKHFAFGFALLGCTALACGSDDSGGSSTPGGCQANPNSCAADQTCWPNAAGNALECLPANATKPAGSSCVNLAGTADCGAGMFCFPNAATPQTGTCSPFCQGTSCAGGAACAKVQIINTAIQVNVCMPGGGTGGAGGTGGTGGSDAGSGAAAGAGATAGAGGSSDAGAGD